MAARIALVEVAIKKTQTNKRTAKAAVIDFFHPGTGRYIRPPMSVRKLSAAGSLIPSRGLGQKGTQGAADQPYQRRGDEGKDSENWRALRPGDEEIGDGKNHHERSDNSRQPIKRATDQCGFPPYIVVIDPSHRSWTRSSFVATSPQYKMKRDRRLPSSHTSPLFDLRQHATKTNAFGTLFRDVVPVEIRGGR